MKHKNKLLVSMLVSSQVLGIGIPLIGNTNVVHAEVIVQQGMSPEDTNLYEELVNRGLYSNHLNNEMIKLTEEIEGVEDLKGTNAVIETFTELYLEVSEDKVYRKADLRLLDDFKALDIHESILDLIHEHGNKETMITYANLLVMGYVNADPAYEKLITHLIENNELKEAEGELRRVNNMFNLYQEKLFDTSYPEIEVTIESGRLKSEDLEFMLGDDIYKENIEVPEFIDKSDEFVDDSAPSEEEINKITSPKKKPSTNTQTPSRGLPERTGSYYEYDANKGIRYHVTFRIRMVGGKEVRTENRRIDATGLTSMWSDRLRSFGGNITTLNPNDFEVEPEEVDEEKRLTLQYSLNKDDLFPSYIDTGIYTDEDGNADYKSMYDVLFQIAVNATDGYLVEDNDKLLIVVEGMPIYITEKKDSYTQSEVEDIFNEFKKIDLVVQETRIGTTDTLEWQLRTGKSQSLVVDGDKIDLTTQPEVRGNRVVLPIVETFKAIGADVTEDGSVMIANYKGVEVKLENGVSEARVDGKLIDMIVPIESSERGFYTGNITPVFKELDIVAEWDEQESSLVLSNTERVSSANENSSENEDD